MNIDEAFSFVNYISNKKQSGRSMSPSIFNLQYPEAELDFINLRIGLPERYKEGRAIPAIAWELTQRISDDISVLKMITTLTVASDGTTAQPSDYLYVTSIRYPYTKTICGKVKERMSSVRIIDDDQWGEMVDSSVRTPTLQYPIAKFDSKSLEFAPKNIKSVTFSYLRYPIKAFWNFTIDPITDVPVYTAVGSTDSELPASTHTKICSILLGRIGINLSDTELIQYAGMAKERGII